MAKLPRSPIAQDVRNNYQPVREARMSDVDPVGRAIEGVGDTGLEIANRMADAKIASDAAKAEIELTNRLDLERRALEDDNEIDPASLEAMFQERANKVVSEISGNITSPALKRAFGNQSAAVLQRNTIQVRDLSRRKQVDIARGEFVTTVEAYSKTYDEPSNYLQVDPTQPSMAQERLDSQKSFIQSQFRAGIITAEAAADQTIKAEDAFAKGLERKHLNAIDAALDNGDYSGADSYFMANSGDFTSEEMRQKTRDVIEAKQREGGAITIADELWDKSGQNYGEFLNLVRDDPRIKDPEMLQRVEGRGGVRLNQYQAAVTANDTAQWNAGMEYITTGQRIPASLMRDASPKVRDMLQAEQRQRDLHAQQMATASAQEKAAMREVSMGNYRILKAQMVSDPELALLGVEGILADPNLSRLWEGMSPDERGQFVLDAANAKGSGGAPADAVSKAYKSVVNLASAYMPENLSPKDYGKYFDGVGEGDVGVAYLSSNRKKPDTALVFEGELMRLVDEEMARTGGADIQADRAKQLVALAYAKAGADPKTGKTKYPISQDIAAGAVQTDMRRIALDYRRQNPAIWSEAVAIARGQYPNASEALILEEARKLEQRNNFRRATQNPDRFGREVE
jgi:hypothetical protein